MFNRLLIFLIIFSIGFAFGHSYLTPPTNELSFQNKKNTPEAFIAEIYDNILKNYWDNISDTQLLEQFSLSFDKSGGGIVTKFDSKEKLITAIQNATKNMDEDKRNKFVATLAGSVLVSLNPVGRSGLFTTKMEEQLKNTVENINPEVDLYKDLGISKGATDGAVLKAFETKSQQLAQDKSKESQEKLKSLTYAKDVLTQKDTKEKYDQKGIEPTIFTKILNEEVLYFQFKKFSPTSLDEFVKAFDSYKNNAAVISLIFDLRGNVGGAIDATTYFAGHFIGKNQNAYDFYHKGEYLPFKTTTEKLPSISKYKQIVVLIDNQTQSSAEILAAVFKKYHIGVVVGLPSKGWGTVERVFQLDNQIDQKTKYSMFLVHSITLRDDNQPIEGRGVEPDVNIKNSDFEKLLFSYFRNNQLISAIKSVL